MSNPNAPNSSVVPSPQATGQGGGFFEQHVNATWLSILLVKGIPPLLTDSQVTKVSFQNGRLGWKTDDVLIQATTGAGEVRKLLAQVKRTFSVSSKDEDAKKTFLAFWTDFSNPDFNRSSDRLCLITLRGTNILLEHFSGLLDAALRSSSATDFKQRLSTEGMVSAPAKRHAEEIKKILDEAGLQVNEENFWQFLKNLNVLSFDLNSKSSQTEAWIKSLLAQTAKGSGRVEIAGATWNALVTLASQSMPTAAEFTRETLPEEIKRKHDPIPDGDHAILQAMADHSSVILREIRTEIGAGVTLERRSILTEANAGLGENSILVIAGPSGHGKSAIAKKLVNELKRDHFVFSFRAEEFAKPHLDQVLQSFGLGLSGERLFAILSAQSKKVVHIESAERLLEATTRDAFMDLFRLIETDASWKVVLTCRSYSVDLVRSSFLNQTGIPHSVVKIPALTGAELSQVEKAIPKLAAPLANSRLRKLLENPYILDKAAKMDWPPGEVLPENEREFRRRFWRDIVREDGSADGGLPLRREKALQQVSLRRAKALSLYANVEDLDQEALSKLKQQGLIVFSEASGSLATPAHDVLEDWSLIGWIEERFAHSESNAKALHPEIGTFPALRRCYRIWLSENAEINPLLADRLVNDVIKDSTIPSHFRDDTLVSVLKASTAANFLERNRAALSADDCELLRRVMHLMRLACREMPEWLAQAGYLQSSAMEPIGFAWPKALSVALENIDALIRLDFPLVLGFLEDWSSLINPQSRTPEGIREAARIAFHLLQKSVGYKYSEERKRLHAIIAKLPGGDRESFAELLDRGGRKDRDADEFADFLIEGRESIYASIEFPSEVIELTKRRLYFEGKDDPYSRIDVDEFFGIESHRDFHPPSALRGPFWPLLNYHFKSGLQFILDFTNRACERFANPRSPDRLDPPWEVEITLSDGKKILHWHHPRLWQMYRGTSVGPNVLMCALMALEKRLLDMGTANVKVLDDWLVHILTNSNNSALAAVVASIVSRFPSQCIQAAKCLLSCRDYIEIDQSMAGIGDGVSKFQEIIPNINVKAKIYENERKESDSLPHRHRHIGIAALELQLGVHQAEFQTVIDEHLKNLPPAEGQTDGDKIWRFTLHKMDARKYSPREAKRKELKSSSGKEMSEEEENETVGVVLEPHVPERDVKEILDRDRPKLNLQSRYIGMSNWAFSLFSGSGNADPSLWREILREAMDVPPPSEPDDMAFERSPELVAAICSRDHWNELTVEQKKWCLDRVDTAILRDRDSDDDTLMVQKFAMNPDRASALVISKIIATEGTGPFRAQAEAVLRNALFHSVQEVTSYAALGIGHFLMPIEKSLAFEAVNLLCERSDEMSKCYEEEMKKPWEERDDLGVAQVALHERLRKKWASREGLDSSDFSGTVPKGAFSEETLTILFFILKGIQIGPSAMRFFEAIAAQICEWWAAKETRDERVPFHTLAECEDALVEFALRLTPEEAAKLCAPLLGMLEKQSKEVAGFIKRLVLLEDRTHLNKSTFWRIWSDCAEGICKCSWVNKLSNSQSWYDEIFTSIFLSIRWKNGAKDWEPQKDYEQKVVSLFDRLPPSASVFERFCTYLYLIGDVTLPNAFTNLSNKVKEKPGAFVGQETVFLIEQILQRYVYGGPLKLKSDRQIREAVIYLLDILVDRGSSAAYKMRDDFVTPLGD